MSFELQLGVGLIEYFNNVVATERLDWFEDFTTDAKLLHLFFLLLGEYQFLFLVGTSKVLAQLGCRLNSHSAS